MPPPVPVSVSGDEATARPTSFSIQPPVRMKRDNHWILDSLFLNSTYRSVDKLTAEFYTHLHGWCFDFGLEDDQVLPDEAGVVGEWVLSAGELHKGQPYQ